MDTTDVSEATEKVGNISVFDDMRKRPSNSLKKTIPVQALRSENSHPWLMIDRVSSASSASEIFDKVSEFDETTQLNSDDFTKLVNFTKEVSVAKK